MRKSYKVMIVTAVVAVLAIAYALIFGRDSGNSDAKKGKRDTVFSVITQVASKEILHGYVIANGEIESQNSVNVYPDVSGKVIETNVMLGSSVKRGDVIASVDPSAPGQFFKKSPVYAPISGSIISTPLKNGTTVNTNTVIAIVGDISNLQVSADIPERFVAVLKPGLKADVSVEAYPGVKFGATVTRVSPVVDAASRTKQIILAFDKKDSRVNAGMFGKVVLYTEDYSGFPVMPGDGLVQMNDEYYAFVVNEDSTVSRRHVKIGNSVDGMVQLVDGVAEGEKVVIQGQTSLSDGSKVRDITVAGAGQGENADKGEQK